MDTPSPKYKTPQCFPGCVFAIDASDNEPDSSSIVVVNLPEKAISLTLTVRERHRQRNTDTQINRQTQRQAHRQICVHADRHIDWQNDKTGQRTGTQKHTQADSRTKGRADTQIHAHGKADGDGKAIKNRWSSNQRRLTLSTSLCL